MKAVILLAGKSTRAHPLSLTRPKPLLEVAGKTILEHNLDALHGIASEAILVVGYMKSMIRERYNTNYRGMKLSYISQDEQRGTGHALVQARASLERETKPFIVMYGDNIYNRKDIKACLRHKCAILGVRVQNPRLFGVLHAMGDRLLSIDEKPLHPKSSLVNAGLYVLEKDMLSGLPKTSVRGELELTDMITALCKKRNVSVVESRDYWLPIGYPWDLLDANSTILKNLRGRKRRGATVEKHAVLKGAVHIGKGSLVRSGAYIEGPVWIGENCRIGPNCFIRPCTSIGNNCKVGNGCEVKNSILFDDVSVGHLSYVGDSVLGEGVNLGAGTITANLKHDDAHVKSVVKGELIETGRRKLGAIIGDGVHTGIHTSIYPGRKIWPNKWTMPGEVVKRDVV